MQKISPCLWFDNQAEEAARYYVSIFKNSKVGAISYYGEGMPMPKGTVLTVVFELDGQSFTALNGGPVFKFTEAVSMVVNCDDQAEVDRMWEALSEGGSKSVCGWLRDKYGLSWQVVPKVLAKYASDPKTSDKVMAAVMQMTKLDIAKLEAAAAS